MQAQTRSIFELFGSKRRYLVPLFQRQYVWGQERQLEPLWDDVRGKAMECLAGQDPEAHFMGAIVLCQVQTFGNQVLAHDIIDGQQRLTTFQLLLAALRDVARERGEDMVERELRPYTGNEGLMEQSTERFKVWPTLADQEAFQAVMAASGPGDVEAAYPRIMVRKKVQPGPRMVEAYRFFLEAIRAFLEESPETATAIFHALITALNRKLQVVSIELEKQDDPQVIFETLNARGEPLLPSDLLRNFIFHRATRRGETPAELYERFWYDFDARMDRRLPAQPFWKLEERQGRLKRARIDLFMQHYLILKLERDVNIAKLYQTYRSWILETTPFATIEAELIDIQKHAAFFAQIVDAQEETRLGQLARRLKAIDTATIYPVLLYVMAEPALTTEDRTAILRDLESYLVRRMVVRLTNKNYNLVFPQLIRDMRKQGGITPARLRTWLQSLTGESSRWPSDQEFAQAWQSGEAYQRMDNPKLTMVLAAIEQELHDAKREQFQLTGELTVEHVMPQAWRPRWPLPDGSLATEELETSETLDRDRVLHTFGNLTLLTQALNSSLGNATFADRQTEIAKHSALQLNTYFHGRTSWQVEDIEQRGHALFELALKLWPSPAPAAPDDWKQHQVPANAPASTPSAGSPAGEASTLPDLRARFDQIEAQGQGQSQIASLGFTHFLKLVSGIGPGGLETALVEACHQHGFRIKVVKQELSIYSDRPRMRAFYANARRREAAMEIFFNPGDPRLPSLTSKFATVEIPEYVGFRMQSPAEVTALMAGIAAAELAVP